MTDKELKDWCTGFALAAFLTPHPIPHREPIGYLYGHVAKEGETPTHTINGVDYVGVVAPKVLEPPRNGYPYEVIAGPYTLDGYTGVYYKHIAGEEQFSSYGVYNSWDDPVAVYPRYLATTKELADGLNESLELSTNVGVNTWGDTEEVVYFDVSLNILWTNTDIYNPAGKILYMEAIDPIPIYE